MRDKKKLLHDTQHESHYKDPVISFETYVSMLYIQGERRECTV
jgi:hypothetical protein